MEVFLKLRKTGFYVVQNRGQWKVLVKTGINLHVP
jgi:hypothetical protein